MTLARIQELVDEYCRQRGITIAQFAADVAKVDRGNLVNGLSGKKPLSDPMLKSLSEALGVPLNQLMAWREASRLGPEGLDSLWEHSIAPQMTVDEWIEAIRRLPPGEKAKARAELEAVLREIENQEEG